MRAFPSLLIVGVVASLGGCAQMRAGGGEPRRIDGAYVVETVNGVRLPAPTWVRTKSGERCTVETLAGVLLMDSAGRWTALVTERESCEGRDGARRVGSEKSSLLSGKYALSGPHLTLHSDDFGTDDAGEFDGDEIVVKSVGVLDDAGQTAVYVARRLK